LDCAATQRGVWLGVCAKISRPGSRSGLRRSLYHARSRDGHS
jgi:hypothetical protein